MTDKSTLRGMLSVVMCFTMLNIHANIEQMSEQRLLSVPEQDSSIDISDESTSNVIYEETSRDGVNGEVLSEMVPSLAKASDDDKWIADVASRIQLHGYAQGWYYYQRADGKNSNTFLCKRTLFWANAQITKRWSFLFMHDFNSVVQEYYTDFRITRNNALTIRFGQFKNALSYENPLSPTSMETIDAYSEGVTYLTGCGTDPLLGVQYGRDQGVSLYGELNNKKLRYEVQVLNGQGINKRDGNNKKDVIARLEYRPMTGLNLCVTGQLGYGHSLVGNSVFNPGIAAGEDYRRDRWTAGFDYKSKWFNMHGEYLWGKDGKVKSDGAYLTGSVPLAKLPKSTSLDMVWSYDYFNFNKQQNMDMHKAVVGLQYWFFKRCRFQAQYVYKNADTNYSTYFNRGDTHQFICQMQVRFN